tara:strand:+ start:32 stop:475 length:444 start_codon:yes stop_codon:yes gene_type:complete
MAFVSAGLKGLLGGGRGGAIAKISKILGSAGSKPVDNTHSHGESKNSTEAAGTAPSGGIPSTVSQGQEEALPSIQNMNFSKNAQAVGSELWSGKMSSKDFNQTRDPIPTETLDPTVQAPAVNPPRAEPIDSDVMDDSFGTNFIQDEK